MISLWGTTAGNLLMTFIISMVPVIELRGAIPLGVYNGLDVWTALVVAIIGNLVPVPFIIIFIRKIFKWMQEKSEKLAVLVRKFEEKADVRDSKAIKRIATAYMKLLFPHWRNVSDVNKDEFEMYCLNPAVHRRGIVKEQCHNIDPEFKSRMPEIYLV